MEMTLSYDDIEQLEKLEKQPQKSNLRKRISLLIRIIGITSIVDRTTGKQYTLDNLKIPKDELMGTYSYLKKLYRELLYPAGNA